MSYPAVGNPECCSEEFDPRSRPWYVRASWPGGFAPSNAIRSDDCTCTSEECAEKLLIFTCTCTRHVPARLCSEPCLARCGQQV